MSSGINLLPPAQKQDLLFARRNTKLLHWLFVLIGVIGGFGLLVILGQLYIGRSVSLYTGEVAKAQDILKVQKLDDTQKRVEEISTQIKLVVQVLGREVLFSKLVRQIGAAMPNNSVLTSLSITKTQGGLDLQAAALDQQTATQIQINLQDPANKLFDKVDINSIQCSDADATAIYPCRVSLRALFAKNNPFLFIPAAGATSSGSKP